MQKPQADASFRQPTRNVELESLEHDPEKAERGFPIRE
jgi:hypothetical protein